MSNILSKTTRRFSGKRFFQFAICIWALLFSASLPAQETQEKVEVNDVTRHFVLHLPPGYKADQRYPVVILFHGRNQDADDIERITHFNQLADKNGIIALYPAAQGQWNIGVRAETPSVMPRRGMGRRGGWGGGYPGGGGGGGGYPGGGGGGQNGGQNPEETRSRPEPPDDVAFVGAMLDQLALKYSLDVHRIYATGLNDGGFMAERIGCSMADRVAAVATVGASFPKTMICLPSRAVPVLFIDGTEDPIIPYNGGTDKARRIPVLSAEDSAKTWAKFDRCGEKPAQDKIPPLEKGSKETKTYTYNGCQGNAQVVLYSVKDGGNTWPGGEVYTTEKEVGKTSNALNANESIWNFFANRRLPSDNDNK
ncbi:MAG: PHB depolymerase family esterase [Candidatus Sulfotelmatobacter sp.]|jgi:polyhydroxybutyrate depolymerase